MEKNPLPDIIARTCLDRAFRQEFLKDPAGVLRRAGVQVPAGISVQVIENTDQDIHIVLPSGPGEEPAGWTCEKMAVPLEEVTAAGLTIKWARDRMHLTGAITAENAPVLRQELGKVTAEFLVDFREVAFMGSAGLAVLLATQKRLTGSGKSLYLGNVSPAVRNIFSLTGLEPLFKFVDPDASDGWWMALPVV